MFAIWRDSLYAPQKIRFGAIRRLRATKQLIWRDSHLRAITAAHIGFVAKSEAEVNAFYNAAMAAGVTASPAARLYYDLRYYAANVLDSDGYSLEAVYKSWQHRQS